MNSPVAVDVSLTGGSTLQVDTWKFGALHTSSIEPVTSTIKKTSTLFLVTTQISVYQYGIVSGTTTHSILLADIDFSYVASP
jgi:hypothetical protein